MWWSLRAEHRTSGKAWVRSLLMSVVGVTIRAPKSLCLEPLVMANNGSQREDVVSVSEEVVEDNTMYIIGVYGPQNK